MAAAGSRTPPAAPGEDVPAGRATRSVPEPLTEPGHGLDRVVPFAVQPPIDPALQAVPGRREPTAMTAVATRLPPNPTPSRSSHSASLTTATYTATPPAVSSPYTTVRLMSRSMSYSR